MITGFNQEVDILGRTFHFQTELSRRPSLLIRTEVFVGGKVVATRENLLDPAAEPSRLDEGALRADMKAQHQRVIQSTVERVTAFQERKQEPPEPATGPGLPAYSTGQVATLAPPSAEMKKKVGTAIRIRRIFSKFRLRLGLGAKVPNADIAERLEMAGRGFQGSTARTRRTAGLSPATSPGVTASRSSRSNPPERPWTEPI